MAEIQFETGVVSYSFNGKVDVRFNPMDSGFLERLFSTFDALDQKREAYKVRLEKTADKVKVYEIIRSTDIEMRTLLDGLFDIPVCDALFGDIRVDASSDGCPLWVNLLLAVMGEVRTAFAREKKRDDPCIAERAAKYRHNDGVPEE